MTLFGKEKDLNINYQVVLCLRRLQTFSIGKTLKLTTDQD